MTDEEIIKAMECCNGGLDYCKGCPAKEYNVECGNVLKFNVLNLINRQKAEIENLQKELKIKSLTRANIFEITDAYQRGMSKGIKKFAEMLKCKVLDHDFTCADNHIEETGQWLIHEVVPDMINNLLKEMTEDDNDNTQV